MVRVEPDPAVKWPMYRHTYIPHASHDWRPGMISPSCRKCGAIMDSQIDRRKVERRCPDPAD